MAYRIVSLFIVSAFVFVCGCGGEKNNNKTNVGPDADSQQGSTETELTIDPTISAYRIDDVVKIEVELSAGSSPESLKFTLVSPGGGEFKKNEDQQRKGSTLVWTYEFVNTSEEDTCRIKAVAEGFQSKEFPPVKIVTKPEKVTELTRYDLKSLTSSIVGDESKINETFLKIVKEIYIEKPKDSNFKDKLISVLQDAEKYTVATGQGLGYFTNDTKEDNDHNKSQNGNEPNIKDQERTIRSDLENPLKLLADSLDGSEEDLETAVYSFFDTLERGLKRDRILIKEVEKFLSKEQRNEIKKSLVEMGNAIDVAKGIKKSTSISQQEDLNNDKDTKTLLQERDQLFKFTEKLKTDVTKIIDLSSRQNDKDSSADRKIKVPYPYRKIKIWLGLKKRTEFVFKDEPSIKKQKELMVWLISQAFWLWAKSKSLGWEPNEDGLDLEKMKDSWIERLYKLDREELLVTDYRRLAIQILRIYRVSYLSELLDNGISILEPYRGRIKAASSAYLTQELEEFAFIEQRAWDDLINISKIAEAWEDQKALFPVFKDDIQTFAKNLSGHVGEFKTEIQFNPGRELQWRLALYQSLNNSSETNELIKELESISRLANVLALNKLKTIEIDSKVSLEAPYPTKVAYLDKESKYIVEAYLLLLGPDGNSFLNTGLKVRSNLRVGGSGQWVLDYNLKNLELIEGHLKNKPNFKNIAQLIQQWGGPTLFKYSKFSNPDNQVWEIRKSIELSNNEQLKIELIHKKTDHITFNLIAGIPLNEWPTFKLSSNTEDLSIVFGSPNQMASLHSKGFVIFNSQNEPVKVVGVAGRNWLEDKLSKIINDYQGETSATEGAGWLIRRPKFHKNSSIRAELHWAEKYGKAPSIYVIDKKQIHEKVEDNTAPSIWYASFEGIHQLGRRVDLGIDRQNHILPDEVRNVDTIEFVYTKKDDEGTWEIVSIGDVKNEEGNSLAQAQVGEELQKKIDLLNESTNVNNNTASKEGESSTIGAGDLRRVQDGLEVTYKLILPKGPRELNPVQNSEVGKAKSFDKELITLTGLELNLPQFIKSIDVEISESADNLKFEKIKSINFNPLFKNGRKFNEITIESPYVVKLTKKLLSYFSQEKISTKGDGDIRLTVSLESLDGVNNEKWKLSVEDGAKKNEQLTWLLSDTPIYSSDSLEALLSKESSHELSTIALHTLNRLVFLGKKDWQLRGETQKQANKALQIQNNWRLLSLSSVEERGSDSKTGNKVENAFIQYDGQQFKFLIPRLELEGFVLYDLVLSYESQNNSRIEKFDLGEARKCFVDLIQPILVGIEEFEEVKEVEIKGEKGNITTRYIKLKKGSEINKSIPLKEVPAFFELKLSTEPAKDALNFEIGLNPNERFSQFGSITTDLVNEAGMENKESEYQSHFPFEKVTFTIAAVESPSREALFINPSDLNRSVVDEINEQIKEWRISKSFRSIVKEEDKKHKGINGKEESYKIQRATRTRLTMSDFQLKEGGLYAQLKIIADNLYFNEKHALTPEKENIRSLLSKDPKKIVELSNEILLSNGFTDVGQFKIKYVEGVGEGEQNWTLADTLDESRFQALLSSTKPQLFELLKRGKNNGETENLDVTQKSNNQKTDSKVKKETKRWLSDNVSSEEFKHWLGWTSGFGFKFERVKFRKKLSTNKDSENSTPANSEDKFRLSLQTKILFSCEGRSETLFVKTENEEPAALTNELIQDLRSRFLIQVAKEFEKRFFLLSSASPWVWAVDGTQLYVIGLRLNHFTGEVLVEGGLSLVGDSIVTLDKLKIGAEGRIDGSEAIVSEQGIRVLHDICEAGVRQTVSEFGSAISPGIRVILPRWSSNKLTPNSSVIWTKHEVGIHIQRALVRDSSKPEAKGVRLENIHISNRRLFIPGLSSMAAKLNLRAPVKSNEDWKKLGKTNDNLDLEGGLFVGPNDTFLKGFNFSVDKVDRIKINNKTEVALSGRTMLPGGALILIDQLVLLDEDKYLVKDIRFATEIQNDGELDREGIGFLATLEEVTGAPSFLSNWISSIDLEFEGNLDPKNGFSKFTQLNQIKLSIQFFKEKGQGLDIARCFPHEVEIDGEYFLMLMKQEFDLNRYLLSEIEKHVSSNHELKGKLGLGSAFLLSLNQFDPDSGEFTGKLTLSNDSEINAENQPDVKSLTNIKFKFDGRRIKFTDQNQLRKTIESLINKLIPVGSNNVVVESLKLLPSTGEIEAIEVDTKLKNLVVFGESRDIDLPPIRFGRGGIGRVDSGFFMHQIALLLSEQLKGLNYHLGPFKVECKGITTAVDSDGLKLLGEVSYTHSNGQAEEFDVSLGLNLSGKLNVYDFNIDPIGFFQRFLLNSGIEQPFEFRVEKDGVRFDVQLADFSKRGFSLSVLYSRFGVKHRTDHRLEKKMGYQPSWCLESKINIKLVSTISGWRIDELSYQPVGKDEIKLDANFLANVHEQLEYTKKSFSNYLKSSVKDPSFKHITKIINTLSNPTPFELSKLSQAIDWVVEGEIVLKSITSKINKLEIEHRAQINDLVLNSSQQDLIVLLKVVDKVRGENSVQNASLSIEKQRQQLISIVSKLSLQQIIELSEIKIIVKADNIHELKTHLKTLNLLRDIQSSLSALQGEAWNGLDNWIDKRSKLELMIWNSLKFSEKSKFKNFKSFMSWSKPQLEKTLEPAEFEKLIDGIEEYKVAISNNTDVTKFSELKKEGNKLLKERREVFALLDKIDDANLINTLNPIQTSLEALINSDGLELLHQATDLIRLTKESNSVASELKLYTQDTIKFCNSMEQSPMSELYRLLNNLWLLIPEDISVGQGNVSIRKRPAANDGSKKLSLEVDGIGVVDAVIDFGPAWIQIRKCEGPLFNNTVKNIKNLAINNAIKKLPELLEIGGFTVYFDWSKSLEKNFDPSSSKFNNFLKLPIRLIKLGDKEIYPIDTNKPIFSANRILDSWVPGLKQNAPFEIRELDFYTNNFPPDVEDVEVKGNLIIHENKLLGFIKDLIGFNSNTPVDSIKQNSIEIKFSNYEELKNGIKNEINNRMRDLIPQNGRYVINNTDLQNSALPLKSIEAKGIEVDISKQILVFNEVVTLLDGEKLIKLFPLISNLPKGIFNDKKLSIVGLKYQKGKIVYDSWGIDSFSHKLEKPIKIGPMRLEGEIKLIINSNEIRIETPSNSNVQIKWKTDPKSKLPFIGFMTEGLQISIKAKEIKINQITADLNGSTFSFLPKTLQDQISEKVVIVDNVSWNVESKKFNFGSWQLNEPLKLDISEESVGFENDLIGKLILNGAVELDVNHSGVRVRLEEDLIKWEINKPKIDLPFKDLILSEFHYPDSDCFKIANIRGKLDASAFSILDRYSQLKQQLDSKEVEISGISFCEGKLNVEDWKLVKPLEFELAESIGDFDLKGTASITASKSEGILLTLGDKNQDKHVTLTYNKSENSVPFTVNNTLKIQWDGKVNWSGLSGTAKYTDIARLFKGANPNEIFRFPFPTGGAIKVIPDKAEVTLNFGESDNGNTPNLTAAVTNLVAEYTPQKNDKNPTPRTVTNSLPPLSFQLLPSFKFNNFKDIEKLLADAAKAEIKQWLFKEREFGSIKIVADESRGLIQGAGGEKSIRIKLLKKNGSGFDLSNPVCTGLLKLNLDLKPIECQFECNKTLKELLGIDVPILRDTKLKGAKFVDDSLALFLSFDSKNSELKNFGVIQINPEGIEVEATLNKGGDLTNWSLKAKGGFKSKENAIVVKNLVVNLNNTGYLKISSDELDIQITTGPKLIIRDFQFVKNDSNSLPKVEAKHFTFGGESTFEYKSQGAGFQVSTELNKNDSGWIDLTKIDLNASLDLGELISNEFSDFKDLGSINLKSNFNLVGDDGFSLSFPRFDSKDLILTKTVKLLNSSKYLKEKVTVSNLSFQFQNAVKDSSSKVVNWPFKFSTESKEFEAEGSIKFSVDPAISVSLDKSKLKLTPNTQNIKSLLDKFSEAQNKVKEQLTKNGNIDSKIIEAIPVFDIVLKGSKKFGNTEVEGLLENGGTLKYNKDQKKDIETGSEIKWESNKFVVSVWVVSKFGMEQYYNKIKLYPNSTDNLKNYFKELVLPKIQEKLDVALVNILKERLNNHFKDWESSLKAKVEIVGNIRRYGDFYQRKFDFEISDLKDSSKKIFIENVRIDLRRADFDFSQVKIKDHDFVANLLDGKFDFQLDDSGLTFQRVEVKGSVIRGHWNFWYDSISLPISIGLDLKNREPVFDGLDLDKAPFVILAYAFQEWISKSSPSIEISDVEVKLLSAKYIDTGDDPAVEIKLEAIYRDDDTEIKLPGVLYVRRSGISLKFDSDVTNALLSNALSMLEKFELSFLGDFAIELKIRGFELSDGSEVSLSQAKELLTGAFPVAIKFDLTAPIFTNMSVGLLGMKFGRDGLEAPDHLKVIYKGGIFVAPFFKLYNLGGTIPLEGTLITAEGSMTIALGPPGPDGRIPGLEFLIKVIGENRYDLKEPLRFESESRLVVLMVFELGRELTIIDIERGLMSRSISLDHEKLRKYIYLAGYGEIGAKPPRVSGNLQAEMFGSRIVDAALDVRFNPEQNLGTFNANLDVPLATAQIGAQVGGSASDLQFDGSLSARIGRIKLGGVTLRSVPEEFLFRCTALMTEIEIQTDRPSKLTKALVKSFLPPLRFPKIRASCPPKAKIRSKPPSPPAPPGPPASPPRVAGSPPGSPPPPPPPGGPPPGRPPEEIKQTPLKPTEKPKPARRPSRQRLVVAAKPPKSTSSEKTEEERKKDRKNQTITTLKKLSKIAQQDKKISDKASGKSSQGKGFDPLALFAGKKPWTKFGNYAVGPFFGDPSSIVVSDLSKGKPQNQFWILTESEKNDLKDPLGLKLPPEKIVTSDNANSILEAVKVGSKGHYFPQLLDVFALTHFCAEPSRWPESLFYFKGEIDGVEGYALEEKWGWQFYVYTRESQKNAHPQRAFGVVLQQQFTDILPGDTPEEIRESIKEILEDLSQQNFSELEKNENDELSHDLVQGEKLRSGHLRQLLLDSENENLSSEEEIVIPQAMLKVPPKWATYSFSGNTYSAMYLEVDSKFYAICWGLPHDPNEAIMDLVITRNKAGICIVPESLTSPFTIYVRSGPPVEIEFESEDSVEPKIKSFKNAENQIEDPHSLITEYKLESPLITVNHEDLSLNEILGLKIEGVTEFIRFEYAENLRQKIQSRESYTINLSKLWEEVKLLTSPKGDTMIRPLERLTEFNSLGQQAVLVDQLSFDSDGVEGLLFLLRESNNDSEYIERLITLVLSPGEPVWLEVPANGLLPKNQNPITILMNRHEHPKEEICILLRAVLKAAREHQYPTVLSTKSGWMTYWKSGSQLTLQIQPSTVNAPTVKLEFPKWANKYSDAFFLLLRQPDHPLPAAIINSIAELHDLVSVDSQSIKWSVAGAWAERAKGAFINDNSPIVGGLSISTTAHDKVVGWAVARYEIIGDDISNRVERLEAFAEKGDVDQIFAERLKDKDQSWAGGLNPDSLEKLKNEKGDENGNQTAFNHALELACQSPKYDSGRTLDLLYVIRMASVVSESIWPQQKNIPNLKKVELRRDSFLDPGWVRLEQAEGSIQSRSNSVWIPANLLAHLVQSNSSDVDNIIKWLADQLKNDHNDERTLILGFNPNSKIQLLVREYTDKGPGKLGKFNPNVSHSKSNPELVDWPDSIEVDSSGRVSFRDLKKLFEGAN